MSLKIASWHWPCGVWRFRACCKQTPASLFTDLFFYFEYLSSIFYGLIRPWRLWKHCKKFIQSILITFSTFFTMLSVKIDRLQLLRSSYTFVWPFLNSLYHLCTLLWFIWVYDILHKQFVPHNLMWRFFLHKKVTNNGEDFALGGILDRHVSQEKCMWP